MSIEYHGWVALATSQADWSDGELESGYQRVAQVIERLCPDDGHEAFLPVCHVLPRVLYLKVSCVESLGLVFRTIEEVVAVFDGAYGELVAGDSEGRWDSSVVTRYRLADGKLARGEQS